MELILKGRKLFITLIFIMLNAIVLFSQNTVDITYIANEGFFIKGQNQKILIDAMFSENYSQFQKPTAETLADETDAWSPFDKVTHVIASHSDKDHYNSTYYSEHMVNNKNAYLIASAQTTSSIKYTTDYAKFSDRVRSITPAKKDKVDTIINTVKFSLVTILHEESSSKTILGTIFTVDGVKFFHMGDANSVNLSEYTDLKLDEDSVDVAFVPYWMYESATGREILKFINPKAIVLMHFPSSLVTTYKTNGKNYEDMPPVYAFEKIMSNAKVYGYSDHVTISGSIFKVVENVTSIERDLIKKKVEIFPNPVNGRLNIIVNSDNIGSLVEIYNNAGQVILTGKVESENYSIDCSSFQKGLYVIRINHIAEEIVVQ